MSNNPELQNTFTDQQLNDWRAYERVRKAGRFNMFDPGACKLTKLSEERYDFVLSNYSALKTAAEQKTPSAI